MDRIRRKGQAESIGLVIVVIIIVIAGTFAVVLMSKNKDKGYATEYLTLNANNLRESMLKAEFCKGVSVKEEIGACNENSSMCYEKCDMKELKKKMKEITEKSIDKNINYAVEVTSSGQTSLISIARGECGSMASSTSQYLVSGNEIKVILCFS